MLTVYGRFPTLGLAENVVYDVLAAVPLGVGNTTLSAFAYEVDCSSLPQAAVVPGGGADASQLVFDLNDGQHTQVNITIPRAFVLLQHLFGYSNVSSSWRIHNCSN